MVFYFVCAAGTAPIVKAALSNRRGLIVRNQPRILAIRPGSIDTSHDVVEFGRLTPRITDEDSLKPRRLKGIPDRRFGLTQLTRVSS